jgi:beta-phosphoglucomutase-like phosphatase (HAD superfamily)
MVTKAADTVLDVEEGRNAGVWIVGVLTGGGSREELEAAGADRVVESVRDLPALLHLRVQAAKLDPLKGASSPAHSR